MTDKLNRRDFAKATGIGAAAVAAGLSVPARQATAEQKTKYDLLGEMKKEFNKLFDPYYHKAKELSDSGKLKLVKEFTLEPWTGNGFEVKKGQVVHYELVDGPQILDTLYLVKDRPKDEFADTYPTSNYAPLTYFEGTHYMTNQNYMRPIMSFIKDTVDADNMRAKFGERAGHSFLSPSKGCMCTLHEQAFGHPNMYCCDYGLIHGIAKVGGNDLARHWKVLPSVFMHFQPHAYDKVPIQYTLYSGKEVFKRGDYVELLAHDDVMVAVSLCPLGDQEDMSRKENLTVYPVKCKIFEGPDGPLETAPAPEWKSRGIDEYIASGFKTDPQGQIGDKNSPTGFG